MSNCKPCDKAKELATKGLNIVEAWANVIIYNPEVEERALERLKVCNNCTSRDLILMIDNKGIYKCGECNCPLIALVRSDEKCELGKW